MGVGRFEGLEEGDTHYDYSKFTVLIIDDNDDYRDMSETMLTLMGFKSILTANNGEDGVRSYIDHIDEIDLIILDLNMPIMDGARFFHEFKRLSSSRKKRPKVLLSTGSFDSPLVDQLLSEGVDKALPKPVDLDLMRKSVYALLSAR